MKRTNFYISNQDTIQEIQASFSHFYPSMDINFFSYSEKAQPDNSCVMFSPDVRICDINPDCRDGYIELNDTMTVDELEKSIRDHFKLHAEISSRIKKRPVTIPQTQHWQSNQKYTEGVRFPERSQTGHFKNVSWGV